MCLRKTGCFLSRKLNHLISRLVNDVLRKDFAPRKALGHGVMAAAAQRIAAQNAAETHYAAFERPKAPYGLNCILRTSRIKTAARPGQ